MGSQSLFNDSSNCTSNLHLRERAWPEDGSLLVRTCSLPGINMSLSKVNKNCGDRKY